MKASGLISAAVLLAALLGGARRAAAEATETYPALLEQKAPAIVSVRVVLKTEMNFGGQGRTSESREEIAGVVVAKDGLILVSYDAFRSDDESDTQFQMKRTPKEIKVVFEGEEKEYEAEIVATDKKVNLAFLKVKDLEGRDVSVVDFNEPAAVELGTKVAAVNRLDKGFDYAPYVRTANVSGSIKKPRKALMLDGSINSEGLPVFTMDGQVVGVLTSIESGMPEDEGEDFGMFRVIMGGGGGGQFVLPGKVVAGLIEQAAKQAAELAQKQAEEGAAKEGEKAGEGGEGSGEEEQEDG